MSADNWTGCPRCKENAIKNVAELDRELTDKYGKIDIAEWTDLQRELKSAQSDLMADERYEFREDYETYLDSDGWVQISYSGYCRTCALSYKFKHSEKVVW